VHGFTNKTIRTGQNNHICLICLTQSR
jgi:hypothetical protein